MADNINTRAIVYDMLMSVEKENTPSHLLLSQTLMKYQYLDKRTERLSADFSEEHWNMRFFLTVLSGSFPVYV